MSISKWLDFVSEIIGFIAFYLIGVTIGFAVGNIISLSLYGVYLPI